MNVKMIDSESILSDMVLNALFQIEDDYERERCLLDLEARAAELGKKQSLQGLSTQGREASRPMLRRELRALISNRHHSAIQTRNIFSRYIGKQAQVVYMLQLTMALLYVLVRIRFTLKVF